MADSTTTTTTTTNVEDSTTTTTTTTAAQPAQNSAGNSADNTQGPSRKESLDSAATASPNAQRKEKNTQVLGQEGQSSQDRMDEARREASKNAKDEQKLSA